MVLCILFIPRTTKDIPSLPLNIYVSGATHVFCFFLKSLTTSQHNLEYTVCRYGFISSPEPKAHR